MIKSALQYFFGGVLVLSWPVVMVISIPVVFVLWLADEPKPWRTWLSFYFSPWFRVLPNVKWLQKLQEHAEEHGCIWA